MTVKENKKGAASALFLAVALFCAGFAGYFYYGIGGDGRCRDLRGFLRKKDISS